MSKVSELEILLEKIEGRTGGDMLLTKQAQDMLMEIKPFVLPVASIVDASKAAIVKRIFQNLTVQQLEEVENFARSTVKHPAKYIEYIHEN